MRIPPFRQIRLAHEDVEDGTEDENILVALQEVGATAQQLEEADAE